MEPAGLVPAGSFHGMRKNFGALIVIAIGFEFVGEGAVLIQVADFICRHVWLREAVQVPTPLIAVLREARANVE